MAAFNFTATKFAVWPKRKQLLRCMREWTLGEISKMTLYIDTASGIWGMDMNLISTTQLGIKTLYFLVEMRLKEIAWTVLLSLFQKSSSVREIPTPIFPYK